MAHRIKSQYFWKMCMTYLRRFSVKWYSSAIPFLVDFQKVFKIGHLTSIIVSKMMKSFRFCFNHVGNVTSSTYSSSESINGEIRYDFKFFFNINILLIYWIDPPKSPEEDLPNFRILVSSKLSNSSQRKITHGFAQNTSL